MVQLENTILNFLDIETTGGNYRRDRMIEIFVNKVLNGKVIDTFHTLINPGFRPNPFITQLTNISYSELLEAPKFENIAKDLYEFINDGILIAHNARFDYSFILNQLKELNFNLDVNYCCTVKLSRYLYPQYKTHKLDSIIQRIGFADGDRHRASYDTLVISKFFELSLAEHGLEQFTKAFNSSIKQSAIPNALNRKLDIKKFPETPGIYIFYGKDDYPLYIGMSKNLRRRILEHFYGDLHNTKDLDINQQLTRIETIQTAGILGAYIRESLLIKKYQPLYNRTLRRNRELIKLEQFITDEGYINICFNTDNDFSMYKIENLIGVFRGKQELKYKLEELVKTHGLCPKFLGLEKAKGACFSYQLGKCKGACIKKISTNDYNNLFNVAFEKIKIYNWPLDSEIIIKETNGNFHEELTFNKWCLIRSNIQDVLFEEIETTKFDLDIYKILHRHLVDYGELYSAELA